MINLHNVLDPYFSKNISLIFHLDASIETCCSRINKRAASDKFEKQGRELLIKVHSAYQEIFKDNNKVVTISTESDKSSVQKNIKKHLDILINE